MGDNLLTEFLVVAPIKDDMLFGLILSGNIALIPTRLITVLLNGNIIPMIHPKLSETEESRVAEVRIPRKVVISPNSVTRIKCKIKGVMPDYIIENYI